jgi:hypothetical protein
MRFGTNWRVLVCPDSSNLSRECCTAIKTAQNRDFNPEIASWTLLAWPPAN